MSFLKWLFANSDEREEILKQEEINKLPDPPEGFEKEEPKIEKIPIDVEGTYRFKVNKIEDGDFSREGSFYRQLSYKVVVEYSTSVTYNDDVTIKCENYFNLKYAFSEEMAYKYIISQLKEGEELMEFFKESIVNNLVKYLKEKNIEEMKKIVNGNPLEINFSFNVPKKEIDKYNI